MRSADPTQSSAGIHIRVDKIRREFDNGVVALDGIDLEVEAGQFLAILGPSGCGKSTLLRLIAGLDEPQGGSVEISSHANIAFVFQDAHLLPWRDVLHNVALPLEFSGGSSVERLHAARLALEQVGLAELVDRFPAQLSGGQRMRVSLARAIVTQPSLLLLDEPFAALDEITRQRLDEQLRALWASRGMTVIFVTHSTPEVAYLSQRAVVMSKRPGRIVADHRIGLPADRAPFIRGTSEFARETRVLYDALERGGA